MASAKIWSFSASPQRGASHSTLPIITTFRISAPRAGRKKCPRAFSMPMATAARQMKNKYGNTQRNNSSISVVFSFHSPHSRAAVMPSNPTPTTPANTTIRPLIRALAVRHMACSPAVFSCSLKTGMNAAMSAPSPSRRRKRLGIMKASTNAPATRPSPMKRA